MRCAEDQFGNRDKRELGALAEDRVKNRFFASCCVRWTLRECGCLPYHLQQRYFLLRSSFL